MATPAAQFERSMVRERVLEEIRGLLQELGSAGAAPMLSGSSQLEHDLGLGSLERVELMARLENAFGVRISDHAATQANTPDDLAEAVLDVPEGAPEAVGVSALRASVKVQQLRHKAEEVGVATAETLVDVLRYRASHDTERAHLAISEDADAEGQERKFSLTFGELYAAAQRCAAELSRRGVSADSRVALMLPTSRAFFVSYAGILLAGAIPVPIYPPFRADRIEEYAARQSAILNNAGVSLLLTFRRAEAVAKLLKPRIPTLEAVLDAEKLMEAADNAPEPSPGVRPLHLNGIRARTGNDIALLQYTSGSTGDPKGVVLTHANLLANIRAVGEAVKMSPDDVGVSWLPLYHDMGLIGAWLTLMYYGIPLAVMSPIAFLTRPERWLWALHHHRGTLGTAPNFAYELCVRKILDKDIEGLDLSSWRMAMNGAEPVNPGTLERFAARFAKYGFRREALLPVYGLAEATLAVTVPPLDRGPVVDRIERETFASQGRAIVAKAENENCITFVSAGTAIPRHEIRVVNDAGVEVAERTEGFLWFRGPSATTGYYRNQAATDALLPLGPAKAPEEFAWVNSGDRAYIANGELYVTGRVKDIIIKGGRNLYPHEVEELAARVEGVRRGCVVAFGIKDQASGTEKMVVVAESRETDNARRVAMAAKMTDEVSRGLGLPPDRVELIPLGSIPKTSSGKLRREETKQLYLAGTLSAGKPPAWLQIARLGAGGSVQAAGRAIVRGVKRGLELLYGVYFAVVFALWIVPTWMIVQLFPDHREAGKFTNSSLKILFFLAGCKVEIHGKEFMGTPGAKIYASNHTSYFDVVALMRGLGVPYRFVAKMEVTGMPFIGTFMRQMGHLSFDRSDAESRLHQAAEMEDFLRKGESVFVFPEGTFTREPGVRQFQLGAFKAAVETGAPIIPVALRGTRKFLPDGAFLPRFSSVTITLSPPIFPQVAGGSTADWHELIRMRDSTREAVAENSGEKLL
ncbi:MAG TPA: AMP-binding protein [Candidatus Acidoferrum sp.]